MRFLPQQNVLTLSVSPERAETPHLPGAEDEVTLLPDHTPLDDSLLDQSLDEMILQELLLCEMSCEEMSMTEQTLEPGISPPPVMDAILEAEAYTNLCSEKLSISPCQVHELKWLGGIADTPSTSSATVVTDQLCSQDLLKPLDGDLGMTLAEQHEGVGERHFCEEVVYVSAKK